MTIASSTIYFHVISIVLYTTERTEYTSFCQQCLQKSHAHVHTILHLPIESIYPYV